MILADDIICKYILHAAAGSLCAIASVVHEHLQNSNLFLCLQCSSWDPSPGLLKEEALEFVLSEIPSCMEQAFLLQALAEQFQRPVITEKNVQTDTNRSGAI